MASVAYSVVEYLQTKADSDEFKGDEALKAAIDTVQKALGVDRNSTSEFIEKSVFPVSLDQIYDAGVEKLQPSTAGVALAKAETDAKFGSFCDAVKAKGFYKGCEEGSVTYLQRQAKLVAKFAEKAKAQVKDTAALEAEAEAKKAEGNAAVASKDFDRAIALYNEALDLSPAGPNSHVYYSNRAAAHCHKHNYKEAINDCEASISIEPTYVKALSRLGLANFYEGNYEEAADAYEKVVDIEPDNKSAADALKKAKNKLRAQAPPAAPAGGMPDMSALAGLMGGMGGGGGGGGGGPDLAGLMNNPMVQQMMQNPAMMSKAQEMMKDPDAMQKAMAMMGGMGGMGGGAPSSSGMK